VLGPCDTAEPFHKMSQKRKRLDRDPLQEYPIDDNLAKRLKENPSVTDARIREVLRSYFSFEASLHLKSEELHALYVQLCRGKDPYEHYTPALNSSADSYEDAQEEDDDTCDVSDTQILDSSWASSIPKTATTGLRRSNTAPPAPMSSTFSQRTRNGNPVRELETPPQSHQDMRQAKSLPKRVETGSRPAAVPERDISKQQSSAAAKSTDVKHGSASGGLASMAGHALWTVLLLAALLAIFLLLPGPWAGSVQTLVPRAAATRAAAADAADAADRLIGLSAAVRGAAGLASDPARLVAAVLPLADQLHGLVGRAAATLRGLASDILRTGPAVAPAAKKPAGTAAGSGPAAAEKTPPAPGPVGNGAAAGGERPAAHGQAPPLPAAAVPEKAEAGAAAGAGAAAPAGTASTDAAAAAATAAAAAARVGAAGGEPAPKKKKKSKKKKPAAAV
jgi:hypothetical protein